MSSSNAIARRPLSEKVLAVKRAYEQPDAYLTRRRYNIEIRAESVRELLGNTTAERILDIGCGDGSMSLQLLSSHNRITLVDISTRMLALARSKVPAEFASQVEIVNSDFMTAELVQRSYDLILCIGVLAHAESPDGLINKLTSLLQPGGSVVMESTDSQHFIGRGVSFYHRVWKLLRPPNYDLNLLASSDVVRMYTRCGLTLSQIYRYSLPVLPGMDRFIPQTLLRRLVYALYGTPKHNRNASLGNECIYLFVDS